MSSRARPETWDANGNLLSDGQRTYTWDAENRLIAIAYLGQSSKLTAFGCDGLGRRTSIASTPAGGGSTTTTSYVWCGDRPCQTRDAANSAIRSYYADGEHLLGVSEQKLYYGIDQIGSVRRVFAGTTSAPAYAYDPYGNALQTSTPATDAGFAGMFYNADSGHPVRASRRRMVTAIVRGPFACASRTRPRAASSCALRCRSFGSPRYLRTP
jgi:YD repeat-containing protein